MIRAALLISCLAGPAFADKPDVPSGTKVELFEVLLDEVAGEDWARFRFLAPEIAADGENAPDYFALVNDFPHLCVSVALPYLTEYTLEPSKVAISLSDIPVEFGSIAPEATQYFEVFSLQDGTCVWEAF